MSKNPTGHEPDIRAAVDLIQRTSAAALKSVVEDVLKLCDRDYAAVQAAMYLAYDEIALHALANTALTEDEFVRAASPSEEQLRNRWRHHQAVRAMTTPAAEGFYRN